MKIGSRAGYQIEALIKIENIILEIVSKLIYLGSQKNANNEVSAEIQRRDCKC